MAKIQKSPDVNLIRLEYPTKKTLGEIIKSEFAKKDIDVTREAVELFQKRMSSQYDKYTDIINQITKQLYPEIARKFKTNKRNISCK